jgi:transglutaminase-like putative cysteine protease
MMRRRRLFASIVLAWLPAGLGLPLGRTGEPAAPAPDPNLPYQAKKANPVIYDVDFSVVVTAPYHTRLLRVWLPLPQSDAGQEVEKGAIDTFPMRVKPRVENEPVYGNQFAFFEFDRPEGAQVIRHRFKIKVWELFWNVDPAKTVSVEKWPAGFEPYLRSDRSIRVDDRFRRLAQDIVAKPEGAARDLAAVFAHVNERMRYDHADASLRASSEHALLKSTGHCSDYHGLCAAVGRALGYPTRITTASIPFPRTPPRTASWRPTCRPTAG